MGIEIVSTYQSMQDFNFTIFLRILFQTSRLRVKRAAPSFIQHLYDPLQSSIANGFILGENKTRREGIVVVGFRHSFHNGRAVLKLHSA